MSMLTIDRKAARVTWTVALTILLITAIYAVRGTLLVFAAALLFAYLLYPLVARFGRGLSSKNRAPALALTYLIVIGILVAAGVAIGSRVGTEARLLAAHPPDLQGFLDRLRAAHPSFGPALDAVQDRIRDQFGGMLAAAPRYSLQILAASSNAIYIVIVPILSFFMIKDGEFLRDSFLMMFRSATARRRADDALEAIHEVLMQYMRSLLILCCTVLVVFGVVMSIIGVQYALLLAVIAFFCEFVPLMGPLTAAIVIIAVSALSGYDHLILLMAFLGIFRIVQDYILSPRLMSHGVALHPLLVIFGVFAGAEIAGVAGVFLSVPILAIARLAFIPRARAIQ